MPFLRHFVWINSFKYRNKQLTIISRFFFPCNVPSYAILAGPSVTNWNCEAFLMVEFCLSRACSFCVWLWLMVYSQSNVKWKKKHSSGCGIWWLVRLNRRCTVHPLATELWLDSAQPAEYYWGYCFSAAVIEQPISKQHVLLLILHCTLRHSKHTEQTK